MPTLPGLPELLVILAVILLVFGVGRIARVGGELGKGISAFRQGMKEGQETTDKEIADKNNKSDDGSVA